MGIEQLLGKRRIEGERWEIETSKSLEVKGRKETLEDIAQRVESKINDLFNPRQFDQKGEKKETFVTDDKTEYLIRQQDIGRGETHTWISIGKKPETNNTAANPPLKWKRIFFEGGGAVKSAVRPGEEYVDVLNTRMNYINDPVKVAEAEKVLQELLEFEKALDEKFEKRSEAGY